MQTQSTKRKHRKVICNEKRQCFLENSPTMDIQSGGGNFTSGNQLIPFKSTFIDSDGHKRGRKRKVVKQSGGGRAKRSVILPTRGRGRPRKVPIADTSTTPISEFVSKRKRGRPKSVGRKKTVKKPKGRSKKTLVRRRPQKRKPGRPKVLARLKKTKKVSRPKRTRKPVKACRCVAPKSRKGKVGRPRKTRN
jgi:hypothetical protein